MQIIVRSGEHQFKLSDTDILFAALHDIPALAASTVGAFDPHNNKQINFCYVYSVFCKGLVTSHSIPLNESRTIEAWAE